MLAVFTAPDAVIIAAVVAAAGSQLATWSAARKAARKAEEGRAKIANEFQNNGGKTIRDAVDRIEHAVKHDVVPRLDHAAMVAADHADRLAVLEARPKSTRPRKAD